MLTLFFCLQNMSFLQHSISSIYDKITSCFVSFCSANKIVPKAESTLHVDMAMNADTRRDTVNNSNRDFPYIHQFSEQLMCKLLKCKHILETVLLVTLCSLLCQHKYFQMKSASNQSAANNVYFLKE